VLDTQAPRAGRSQREDRDGAAPGRFGMPTAKPYGAVMFGMAGGANGAGRSQNYYYGAVHGVYGGPWCLYRGLLVATRRACDRRGWGDLGYIVQ